MDPSWGTGGGDEASATGVLSVWVASSVQSLAGGVLATADPGTEVAVHLLHLHPQHRNRDGSGLSHPNVDPPKWKGWLEAVLVADAATMLEC